MMSEIAVDSTGCSTTRTMIGRLRLQRDAIVVIIASPRS